jgi:hypothetical protein
MTSRDRFEWGRLDCLLFVADCIQAMTGEDLAAGIRGRYTTEVGSKRVLTSDLGGSLTAALTGKLGDPVPIPFSGRGDVVLVMVDGVEAAGVIDLSGERVAVLTLDGLESIPVSAARLAWKV